MINLRINFLTKSNNERKHLYIRTRIKRIIYPLVFAFLLPISLNGQSSWIYGVHSFGDQTPGYLVRLNYLNGQYDTLMYLGYQFIESAGSTIDPYNGRFFLYGSLENTDGNLHIIDLNLLQISSHTIKYGADDIEYIFLNNSLLYRADDALWSFNLNNYSESFIADVEHETGTYSGFNRYYNPIYNAYIYMGGKLTMLDAFSGELINEVSVNPIGSMVIDYRSGNQYNNLGQSVYQHDPFTGQIVELFSGLPGYYSWLVEQHSVYDQKMNKYILPYYNTDGECMLAILDMNDLLLDTVYEQPSCYMTLHQIYCKPQSYLSLIEDTLYVSKGLNYIWNLNGQPLLSNEQQWFVPNLYGDYHTQVNYPDYSSISDTINFLYNQSKTISKSYLISVFPNPFTTATTFSYTLQQPSTVHISIFNHHGNQVAEIQREQSSGKQQVIWNAEQLPSGVYFYRMQTGEQVASGKMLINR